MSRTRKVRTTISWKGRSYRKGGQRVRELKIAPPAKDIAQGLIDAEQEPHQAEILGPEDEP